MRPYLVKWGPICVPSRSTTANAANCWKKYGVPALQAQWEKGMLETAAHPGQRLDWDHAYDDLRTDLDHGRAHPANRSGATRSARSEIDDGLLHRQLQTSDQ